MSDFYTQYESDKKVRDLVKRKILSSKHVGDRWRYDAHDLKFKITHIKRDGKWSSSLIINVAVSGGLKGWGWRTDKNGLCNINYLDNFRSAVSRNREIRRLLEKSVARELRLFGITDWMVNIGKLNLKESV